MLFCGLEFNDGFRLTAKELASDPRFDVAACPREDVAARIADAHIAVPLMSRLDAQMLARAPALRYVLQFGVGLEARCVALRSTQPPKLSHLARRAWTSRRRARRACAWPTFRP